MDQYPAHLAPEFDEGGAVKTPFAEWWERVNSHFPNVPPPVAEQWLHRHWGHSPYDWLRSADYFFTLELWQGEELKNIRYRIDKFRGDQDVPLSFAKQMLETRELWGSYWLVDFMVEHRTFPTPPILLDNLDGHLVDHQYQDPNYYPRNYILIEGHRRFELATYLQNEGVFGLTHEFWIMRRAH